MKKTLLFLFVLALALILRVPQTHAQSNNMIQIIGSGAGISTDMITLNTATTTKCSIDYSVAGGIIVVSTSDTDTSFSLQHQITIHNLQANTKYYFKATCFDQNNNYYFTYPITDSGVDSDGNLLPSFTTAAAASAVTGLDAPVAKITSNSATIVWSTITNTKNLVYYVEKGLSSWSWQGSDDMYAGHSVVLTGLKPATTYQYYVNGVDEDGNIIKSDVKEFTTASGVDLKIDHIVVGPVLGNANLGDVAVYFSNPGVGSFTIRMYDKNSGKSQNILVDNNVKQNVDFMLCPGSYDAIFTIDSNNNIVESNENNNDLEKVFTISGDASTCQGALPTLSIDSGSISANSAGTIYWTTNNNAKCNVEYGQSSTLDTAYQVNAQIVQSPTASNDGRYHFYAKLTNFDSNATNYYQIFCAQLSGANGDQLSNNGTTSAIKVLPKNTNSTAINRVKIIYPNGYENYQQGEYITIKWQGGKDVVEIGVTTKDAGYSNNGFNGLLGWIDTHNYPDGQKVWNGKTVCDAQMGNCFSLTPGQYKIIAVSKSLYGNLIFGIDGPNGDTANFDLSDGYFNILAPSTKSGSNTEPTLPAGQDLKSLISTTYGSDYLNHQITDPSSVKSGLILFRVIRDCATGQPVGQNYPQLTSFGPGRLVNGYLQEVNLDTANYYNYTCNSRFQEQCINDGTFDSYYDEFCATGAVTASPTTTAAPVTPAATVISINDNASQLYSGSIDSLLAQLNEMKNTIAEQAAQIKYLQSLMKNVAPVAQATLSNINSFITYGVDSNTVALGAGQRAAVVNSFKSAFARLPTTQTDFTDVVKIANGRWPGQTSSSSIAWAEQQFQKVYLRAPEMSNAHDNAAVTIMAYGLMQQAANRNLRSETASINIFKGIFSRVPTSANDWNTVAAIAYSGATR